MIHSHPRRPLREIRKRHRRPNLLQPISQLRPLLFTLQEQPPSPLLQLLHATHGAPFALR
jgi:hypothetical protein